MLLVRCAPLRSQEGITILLEVAVFTTIVARDIASVRVVHLCFTLAAIIIFIVVVVVAAVGHLCEHTKVHRGNTVVIITIVAVALTLVVSRVYTHRSSQRLLSLCCSSANRIESRSVT